MIFQQDMALRTVSFLYGRLCNRQFKIISKKISCCDARYATTSAKPDFTSERYNVKRGPFGEISNDHVNFFGKLLGTNRIITDPEECDGYNIDWIKMVRGKLKT